MVDLVLLDVVQDSMGVLMLDHAFLVRPALHNVMDPPALGLGDVQDPLVRGEQVGPPRPRAAPRACYPIRPISIACVGSEPGERRAVRARNRPAPRSTSSLPSA